MKKQEMIERLQSLICSWKAKESKNGNYQLIFVSKQDIEALEEAKRIVREAADDKKTKKN